MQKDNLTHADVMSEYFSDEALKDEFTFTDFDVAESIDEIKSYLAARVTELIDEYGEDDLISRDFLEERYEYRDRINYGAGEEIHQYLNQTPIDMLLKSTRYKLRRAYEDERRNDRLIDWHRGLNIYYPQHLNIYFAHFKDYMTKEQWEECVDYFDVASRVREIASDALDWSVYMNSYMNTFLSKILDDDFDIFDVNSFQEHFWEFAADAMNDAIATVAETMLDWLKTNEEAEAKSE